MEMPTESNPVVVVEGDCLDLLRNLPDGCVDAVITDPPYGTHVERDGYGRRGKWGGTQVIANDGDLSIWGPALAQCRRILKPHAWVVVWCSPKRRDDAGAVCRDSGLQILGELVWDKKSPGLGGGIRYQHETILLCSWGYPSGGCQLASVLTEWVPKGQHGHRQQYHMHEKPIGVSRAIVRYACPPGGLLVDPFAGSGTTLVAAAREGRRAIGCEIDPAHATTARERVAKAMGKGSLFEGAV